MSTQYSGQPGNIMPPAPVAIASSTNATPVVITTSGAHGLTDQTVVDIGDHQVNTNANGVHTATVLSSMTFSVPVAGLGVGGATGTVQSLAPGASYAVPSDGDAENGASVDVALETLGDQTAFLTKGTGAYKLAGLFTFSFQDDTVTLVKWSVVTGAGGTWTQATSGGAVATINELSSGDFVEIDFSAAWMSITLGGTDISIGASLATSSYAPGVTPPAPSRLIGSGKYENNPFGTTGVVDAPLSLSGVKHMTQAGNLDIWLMGITGVAATMNIAQESNLTVKVWRSTGQPQ